MQVTTNTLIRRINKRLRAEDEALMQSRSERARYDLGNYYLVDLNRNYIVARNVDVEALGREIGALQSHETVVT